MTISPHPHLRCSWCNRIICEVSRPIDAPDGVANTTDGMCSVCVEMVETQDVEGKSDMTKADWLELMRQAQERIDAVIDEAERNGLQNLWQEDMDRLNEGGEVTGVEFQRQEFARQEALKEKFGLNKEGSFK